METKNSNEFLFVEIGGSEYAFPIEAVREVLQMLEPTLMPGWPECILGVIDIRGELLPLVDAAPILGKPFTTLSARQYVVVFAEKDKTFGIVVDGVTGVRTSALRVTEGLGPTRGVGTMPVDALAQGSRGPAAVVTPERIAAAASLPSEMTSNRRESRA